jgi:hypothetical protein
VAWERDARLILSLDSAAGRPLSMATAGFCPEVGAVSGESACWRRPFGYGSSDSADVYPRPRMQPRVARWYHAFGFSESGLRVSSFPLVIFIFLSCYVGVSVCILCMGSCCVCGFMWVVVLDVCGSMCVCLMWMFWLEDLDVVSTHQECLST